MNRYGMFVTFWAAVAIVSYNELRINMRVPHPDRYIKACIVWGLLSVVADLGAPEVATIFAVGLLVAMIYGYYTGKPNLVTPSDIGNTTIPTDVGNTQVDGTGKPGKK